LACIAAPWSWLYSLIKFTVQQTRISTATDEWLDLIAHDYFGRALDRDNGEPDNPYRQRILRALVRGAATRTAINLALENLTGAPPRIFEPANTGDTGGYLGGSGTTILGLAYGTVGGWGNLDLPCQVFITVRRPIISGLASLTGYGIPTGGYGTGAVGYVDLALLPGQISDAEIASTICSVLPVNALAWLRIS